MKRLSVARWMWLLIVVGWVIAVWLILSAPHPAGGASLPYPAPATILPPPPPIYRPTATTTPGPVCCYVYAPALWSANITFGVWPKATRVAGE